MTELRGFDLDGETSRAWKAFAGRLADHLADMGESDTLSIGLVGLPTEAPGSVSSAVTFTGFEGSLVRADVAVERSPVLADANGSAPSHESSLDVMLTELGWELDDREQNQPAEPSESPTRTLHGHQVTPQREADHLASVTVRLLCEVLGAVHPVFLRVSGDTDLVDRSPEGATVSCVPDEEPPGVTEPADSAHLRELVTRTIAVDLGAEPTFDGDGDIILEVGTARVFVRVLDQTPVIQIFGRLVHDITYPFEAPAVVARLNADYSFIKFLFGDDAVLACVHLPAIPFVPAQLRRMLATFAEIADHLDDGLVERLGGVREIERAPGTVTESAVAEPGGVPPELLTLLRLDPEGVGLDAEITADICGYDKALAWQLLHIAGGQEAVWQAAAEQSSDDPGEAAKCVEEAAGWKATRRSLVNALDLINSYED